MSVTTWRLTIIASLFLSVSACSTVEVNAEGSERELDWGFSVLF